jgi:hypothetical protein
LSILFSVTDPRGLRVTCTSEVWDEHVLAGHPEMAGCEAEVSACITNPLYGIIYADRDHPKRSIYYMLRKHVPREYLKVVVEVDDAGGIVITAYPTFNVKAREYPQWPISRS